MQVSIEFDGGRIATHRDYHTERNETLLCEQGINLLLGVIFNDIQDLYAISYLTSERTNLLQGRHCTPFNRIIHINQKMVVFVAHPV